MVDPREPATACEGFQVAFTGAAILMLVGVVLLAALVRRSDVANVSPDEPVIPGLRPD